MVIKDTIIEYDIQQAGSNALYALGYIDFEEYNNLIQLPKKNRIIQTGLIVKNIQEEKNDNSVYLSIEEFFNNCVNKIIEKNNINPTRIMEINHDAVWIFGAVLEKKLINKEDIPMVNNVLITFVKKRVFTSMFIYNNIKIYVDSVNKTITARGATLDQAHQFYSVLLSILLDMEFNIDIYDKLHTIKNILEEDPNYYGTNLIININNLSLIKQLIKDLL